MQIIEGCLCIALGGARTTLAGTIVCLVLFSLFVQSAEGATYAIVPFVSRRALGVVSGVVGAGGNAGAVICQQVRCSRTPVRAAGCARLCARGHGSAAAPAGAYAPVAHERFVRKAPARAGLHAMRATLQHTVCACDRTASRGLGPRCACARARSHAALCADRARALQIFFKGEYETHQGIIYMGIMILCLTVVIPLIYFPMWGGMFWCAPTGAVGLPL